MFVSHGRPPSKSKTAKPIELPKHNVAAEPIPKPKKKQVRGMLFTPETNERLNGLYKKFIRGNRESKASDWSEEKSDVHQQQPDGIQPRSNVQHLRTNNSAEQGGDIYGNAPTDQFSQYLRKDNALSPSAYRDSIKLEREDSVRVSENSACVEVQVDRIKTRMQRLLFEQIGITEERVCSTMSDINERTVKLEVRLARFVNSISLLCNNVDQMRYRTSENVVLRELNKELELKIKSLEQERKVLKEQKELEAMKDTVNRMKQVNGFRQERAATPGRDRVAETEKKLLIKQNLQLKKQRDTLQRQFLELKQEQSKLVATCQQMAAYCQQLEKGGGSQISVNIDKEQMYHKVVEHAEQLEKKYDALQFESQRQEGVIHKLNESAQAARVQLQRKNDEITQLKIQLKRSQEVGSEYGKLKNSINQQAAELQKINSDLMETKKKNITLQRQLDRKQTTDKVRSRQIDQLKEENEHLRTQLSQANRAKLVSDSAAEASKSRDNGKEERSRLGMEVDSLTAELSSSRLELAALKEQNKNLQSKREQYEQEIDRLQRSVSEADRELKKYKEQPPQSSSASATYLANALNQLVEGFPVFSKQLPSELLKALQRVHQHIQSLTGKLQQSEQQMRKLNMYKNKLDHILHEDDRVQYNDFETSQVDALFFRQKPKTDANLNEQMKKLAAKLDVQLEENIKNKSEVFRLRKILEKEENNRKLARNGLLGVIDDSLERRERQEQLTLLLSVLQLLEEKDRIRRKLLGR